MLLSLTTEDVIILIELPNSGLDNIRPFMYAAGWDIDFIRILPDVFEQFGGKNPVLPGSKDPAQIIGFIYRGHGNDPGTFPYRHIITSH
jgi:hypothetical protein